MLLFTGLCCGIALKAQQISRQPLSIGQTAVLKSSVMGEDRTLNIYLPEGYEKDTAVYPVIYLLDGAMSEDFLHVAGLVRFLCATEQMPPAIVVGIANTDRKRDFTFPTRNKKDLQQWPTTGHSEKFLQFMEQEVQPYVEKNLHTNGSRTLIGQSLGGLLATEMLLKKSHLFDQYIIVSPSLWWDDESLLDKAPALLKTPFKKQTRVYVLVGSEGPQMEGDAAQLATAIRAAGNDQLRVAFMFLPEENHLTILHRALYKALGALFAKKQ
ncbi:alpha/beta hydrolase [Chitinophaga solisilvae]|nr:alpha/beta hydrolase-fold protein [Chitinophaga solisilvae]